MLRSPKKSMRRAGAQPLDVLLPVSMWATFVVGMAADAEGLVRSKAPIKPRMRGTKNEPGDVSYCYAYTGILAKLNKRCILMQVFLIPATDDR